METTLSSLKFLRLGVASPELRVADINYNVQHIIATIDQALKQQCQILLFPELCITGYTCADLFSHEIILEKTLQALVDIKNHTAHTGTTVIIGAPVLANGRLFNCGCFISRGKILGIVPKTYLPNTNEFYESRWFDSSHHVLEKEIKCGRELVPFGTDLLFYASNRPECIIGIEICHDLWVPEAPSNQQALYGATVLCNLSASNEVLGKCNYRRLIVKAQSTRSLAVYAYSSSGPGESSTDLVFSGHSIIAENGTIVAETKRFQFTTQIAIADVDLERITNERLQCCFSTYNNEQKWRKLAFHLQDYTITKPRRKIFATPFVPADHEKRVEHCQEIFAIQTTALMKRLKHIHCQFVVLGISGGLDSTLALLVAIKAMDQLQISRKNIITVTMPGFGTTTRTKSNAEKLALDLGTTLRVISIDKAIQQHFKDINHDPNTHDITYENSQARERTQILMDIANQVQGIVIGTGDLSELALGWATYNGDHMSMYSVNCGVPKTLVRYLVEWCAQEEFSGKICQILTDICNTPISPELLPPDKEGNIKQLTEEKIGSYQLNDFFLFSHVRLQYPPRKILFLAHLAFRENYSSEQIYHWLKVFYRRFFTQQFKRSCVPDGPKIGSVALSPRGDWRMSSDTSAQLWLDELDKAAKEWNICKEKK